MPKRTGADARIGQEHPPCDLTPQFFGKPKATANGNVATLDIWLDVRGGDSYLQKCPAVCVIT